MKTPKGSPHRENSCPQLLSLAVHELRTPASVVGGYLRMLQRETDPPLSERQRKMVDEAEKSCARFVAIVAELSELSKLDGGLTTFNRERVDVISLIREVASGMHEPRDRDVRLEVRTSPAAASMIGDRVRLRDAFTAIFRAVMREQRAACTIIADCRIKRVGGRSSVIVVIAEDGCVQGAYKARPGLFDDKRGGLGLSLPIARRVIEGHRGRVWSPQSAAKAGGAVVVSLPIGSTE